MTPARGRPAAWWWWPLLAWLLTGCSLLRPAPGAEGTEAPARSANAPAPWRLVVDAPEPLKALLEQHLDLARLARTPPDDPLDEAEWLRLVGAAPAQARELLQTEGYFAAEVSVRRDAQAPRSAGTPVPVTVAVVPGERVRIGRFDLQAEGELDRNASAGDADARALLATLREGWSLPAGAWFRNEAWSQAKAGVLARLRAAGYAGAAFSGTAADVDTATRQARLFVVVDSGPLYRAGELRIEGLQAHDAATVRHLAGFGPGAPLTENRLLDYQERLLKAELFDSVTVTFDPDPAHAGAAPVSVRVRELPLQQATLGVGISANTGPRVSLDHTHRRLFGWAALSHNKLELGRDRKVWEGEVSSHPGEDFYRNLVGVQYEQLITDTDEVATQRLRLGRTQDTPRIERLYFVELNRALQSAGAVRRDALALSANLHLIWRDLDSVVLPTRGVTLSLQGALGQARSHSFDTGPFARLYARLTGYWPFGAAWYGQARVELGQIVKRDTVAVPASLGFRAGGDDSVRGYAYRTLAPTVDGVLSAGKVLFTTSLELAHPVSDKLPSLWGAVFIDAGRAADTWRNLSPALGYGVGLRWRSPVGPLKLDWAWADELHRGRLHLSVGIAF